MVTRRWILGAAAVVAADLRMNFHARAEETYANKTVFMTSDDGPNAATSIIIDIAERHQVPFTLFMIGTNVAADPDHRKLIERARASGVDYHRQSQLQSLLGTLQAVLS